MKTRGLFASEYGREFTTKELKRVALLSPTDAFAERVEDWQIDLRKTSGLLTWEEKVRLIEKLRRKYNRTIYSDQFKNPAELIESEEPKPELTEKNLARELISYVQKLYYDPHLQKVLAPPVTSKRVFGYMTPKSLRSQFSTYQDTHGRIGGEIILKQANIEI